MSLEEAILKMSASLDANTAAILGNAGAPAAPAPAAEKPAGKAKKETPAPAAPPAAPAVDFSKMNAALEKVKEEKGVEAAKGIIKDVGGVPKRADIPEAKFQAVYDACAEALAAEEEM